MSFRDKTVIRKCTGFRCENGYLNYPGPRGMEHNSTRVACAQCNGTGEEKVLLRGYWHKFKMWLHEEIGFILIAIGMLGMFYTAYLDMEHEKAKAEKLEQRIQALEAKGVKTDEIIKP